ncbi:hypothetical protein PSACC_02869 [Paramicrosporidium saccamoebae]|uniref:Elongator complex protein 2 n=1 Tax=Paramicrosporidium saccamoebae TaxID=1246581 RepID=A0A2H9TI26_9FUNG|nr:hypothetical protein PSACC_02869 [Paramicrosporidium saccamoebae]
MYVSAGCSPETDVLDVSPDGLLAYGSGPNVLITSVTNPRARLVQELPTGHVHCIRLLCNVSGAVCWVMAGSVDGTVRTWTPKGAAGPVLKIGNPVNAIAVARSGDSQWIVCASDTQGNVHLASFDGKDYQNVTSMAVSSRKVISVGIMLVEGVPVVLAGLGDSQLAVLMDSRIVLRLGGHSNWINSIDCIVVDGVLYFATGSSDRTVRVWKVSPVKEKPTGLVELVPSRTEFVLSNGIKYEISCDTIIYGHEGMINSVRWDRQSKRRCLVTASADRSLIIWEPAIDGWKSIMQLGEISGMSTASGFFSGLVCTVNGKERIIAHGATGSIIQYARSDCHELYKVTEPIVTGHTGSIQSCSWEPNGEFLATTSLDKTTRIFAPRLDGDWNEIARPQIHGYDMQAISVLDSGHFLSAGDEKILRSFEAPKSFSIRLKCMNGAALEENEHAEAVVVPALGLSNRMGGSEDERVVLPDMSLDKSPSEYDLCKHTFWIETDKLYGHGLEVYSLAINRTGQLAASASKSTTTIDAAIHFWSRNPNNTWTPLSSINVHALTVVRMKFSPDSRYLLSVSRDRHFSIIDLREQPVCVQYQEAHGRIIWCADWSHDGSFFVTGSRDRTIKTWHRTGDLWTESSRIQFESPVTAVALHASNLMAVGLENGSLAFYRLTNDAWTLAVMHSNAHSAPITDLQWRPQSDQLAAVSNTVQIYSLVS